MVYNNGLTPEQPLNKQLVEVVAMIGDSRFTVLHHARLMWKNPGGYSADEWQQESKNNSWLLLAFAEFVKLRPNLNPLIAIVEYGPDVNLTKQFAAQLGLDDNILWLPKMDRRDVMWLLSHVTIAVGQFYDVPKMIWGGTGWEALASGKPLLQQFNFDSGEFEQLYGYPPPPMLQVRKQADILNHLLTMADQPAKREEIGRGAKEWFNRYNGIGLAKQWLDLLMMPNEVDVKKVTETQSAEG
jgi:hypothetical protein